MARIDVTGEAPYASQITATNDPADPGYCLQGGTAVPVLAKRTIIYVNGRIAATDRGDGAGNKTSISGGITINGVDYTIAGTVTPETGEISLTTVTPKLPAKTEVTVQSFVNYEKRPTLMPSLILEARAYPLFANPWRIETSINADADSQIRNELGIDPVSQALLAIRAQSAAERHYLAIEMMKNVGKFNPESYNFDFAARSQQMNRGQIAVDLRSKLGTMDQAMANRTMDHGITHLYAGATMCSLLASLPTEFFQPSGVAARPGVYRVGRVFDKYELYYTPKKLKDTEDEADLLAIGRSNDVARNPLLMGDSVPPTFLDLAMNSSLNRSAAMYARDYTNVNPHGPSAEGAALLTVKGLK